MHFETDQTTSKKIGPRCSYILQEVLEKKLLILTWLFRSLSTVHKCDPSLNKTRIYKAACGLKRGESLYFSD